MKGLLRERYPGAATIGILLLYHGTRGDAIALEGICYMVLTFSFFLPGGNNPTAKDIDPPGQSGRYPSGSSPGAKVLSNDRGYLSSQRATDTGTIHHILGTRLHVHC